MWTDRLKQVNRNSGSSLIESESEEDSITWSYQSDSEELVDLSPLKQRYRSIFEIQLIGL